MAVTVSRLARGRARALGSGCDNQRVGRRRAGRAGRARGAAILRRRRRWSQVRGIAPAKPRERGTAGPDDWSRAEVTSAAATVSWVVDDAGGAADALRAGCWNVAGMGRIRQRLTGQMMTKARPTTALSGTVPPPGSPRWSRESSEMRRWSPITHSRPGGTVMLNRTSDGALPGYRYEVSFSATPLTVTRPCASQQATLSPGSPMTRLIRISPGLPKPNMLAKPW